MWPQLLGWRIYNVFLVHKVVFMIYVCADICLHLSIDLCLENTTHFWFWFYCNWPDKQVLKTSKCFFSFTSRHLWKAFNLFKQKSLTVDKWSWFLLCNLAANVYTLSVCSILGQTIWMDHSGSVLWPLWIIAGSLTYVFKQIECHSMCVYFNM